MEWIEIPIAKPVVERMKKIHSALGYSSIAQFVGEAVRRFVEMKENELDGINEERRVGREVLGKQSSESDNLPF